MKILKNQIIKDVKHLFAQIIGISSSNVYAKTKAVVAPAKSVNAGIRPFAVYGKKPVLVVGFAAFYVEDVTKNSGNIEISGRFVFNSPIDINLNDTGAYGAKLSK